MKNKMKQLSICHAFFQCKSIFKSLLFQGKPSAGKSTFFNAATSLDLAKTGAHPFTTIEPNIGKVFYSIPCPCEKLTHRCDSGKYTYSEF